MSRITNIVICEKLQLTKTLLSVVILNILKIEKIAICVFSKTTKIIKN